MNDDLCHITLNNRRPMWSSGSPRHPDPDGYYLLARELVLRAIEDIKIYGERGLIAKDGRCAPWPMTRLGLPRLVDNYNDALAHEKLVAFWKNGRAQAWIDMLCLNIDADAAWHHLTQKYCPDEPLWQPLPPLARRLVRRPAVKTKHRNNRKKK